MQSELGASSIEFQPRVQKCFVNTLQPEGAAVKCCHAMKVFHVKQRFGQTHNFMLYPIAKTSCTRSSGGLWRWDYHLHQFLIGGLHYGDLEQIGEADNE